MHRLLLCWLSYQSDTLVGSKLLIMNVIENCNDLSPFLFPLPAWRKIGNFLFAICTWAKWPVNAKFLSRLQLEGKRDVRFSRLRRVNANAPMQCRCQKSGRVANKMQQLENVLWCLIFSVILISLAYFVPWFLQYNTKTIYLCSLTHTMTCISYVRYLKGKQSTSIRHEPLKIQCA